MEKIDIFSLIKQKKEIVEDLTKEELELEKVKSYTPFEITETLFTKKRLPDYVIESSQYNQFMINRIIASTKENYKYEYIELATSINNSGFTNMMHYDYLLSVLPSKNKVYLSYVFNKKDAEEASKEEYIKSLIWKYKYNKRGAEIALLVCDKKELKDLYKEHTLYKKSLGLK